MIFKRKKTDADKQKPDWSLVTATMQEMEKRILSMPHSKLACVFLETKDMQWRDDVFGSLPENLYEEFKSLLIKSQKEMIADHVGIKYIIRYDYMEIGGHTESEFLDYWDSLVAMKRMPIL